MRRPGFEPGLLAWKASVLATRRPAHLKLKFKNIKNFIVDGFRGEDYRKKVDL